MKDLKIGDYILFLFISLFIFYLFYFNVTHKTKKIYIKAKTPESEFVYDKNQSRIISLTGRNGISQFEITEKGIRMLTSVCPNKDCIRQGLVSNKTPILCLPNGIAIWMEETDSEIDTVSF